MHADSVGEDWELVVTPWHLDEPIPGFPLPAGPARVIRPPLPSGPRTGRLIQLYQAVADAVSQAARPLLLSADCTTALGMAAGLQRSHRDVAVVWLDAHGDFNTPATTITGYLGGMPLAMLTGRAAELICDPLGVRPLSDSDVLLVDARDLDPAERDALAASHIRRVPADPGQVGAMLSDLSGKPVYLHVDVDIADSSQLPGLRVPAGPGPALGLIQDCVQVITTAADVAAACIACTWLPEHIGEHTTSEAITQIGKALGARLEFPAL